MMKSAQLRFVHCFAALVLLAPLFVAAADQPKKAGQAGKPATNAESMLRADFSAAMASIKAGDHDKAITLLDQVIMQSPDNPVPYVNLALVYLKLGNLALAEVNLKLAIKLEPDNPVANNEYALLYRKTGRFAEARRIYERLLEKYPNFMMAHKNLGVLCDLYLRDYECALKHYEIYGGHMQDDETVRIWIADLRQRKG